MSDAVKIRTRRVLVIDFYYLDAQGQRLRYTRDATASTKTGARDEARRLMDCAARTGSPFEVAPLLVMALGPFVEETYRPLWLPRLKPSTQERYERVIVDHLLPAFGSAPLDQIDGMAVRKFDVALLSKGVLSPRHVVSVLRAILRAAVDAGELAEFPGNLPTYKQAKKLPSCPSSEDVSLLLEHTTGWLRLAAALMAYAGMRVSEARALQVRDVTQGVIRICRTISGDEGGGVLMDTTKDDDDRTVPIHAVLRPMLTAACQSKLPGAFVLLTEDGNTPRRQHVYDRLRRVQQRNGLTRHGVHALRHYFTTALLGGGAHPEAVRLLTGHADLHMLARYAHATRADLFDAVAKLK